MVHNFRILESSFFRFYLDKNLIFRFHVTPKENFMKRLPKITENMYTAECWFESATAVQVNRIKIVDKFKTDPDYD